MVQQTSFQMKATVQRIFSNARTCQRGKQTGKSQTWDFRYKVGHTSVCYSVSHPQDPFIVILPLTYLLLKW